MQSAMARKKRAFDSPLHTEDNLTANGKTWKCTFEMHSSSSSSATSVT